MATGRLVLTDGRTIPLCDAAARLGRAHVGCSVRLAQTVSRVQCEVRLSRTEQHCQAEVTSRGTNPTVIHRADGGTHLLKTGDAARIESEDRIALCCSAPEDSILFQAAPRPVVQGARRAVVLLLVGVPGSGKSTFSEALIAQSGLPWQRVNQDTIHNGKRGSRAECLAAMRGALQRGHSVLVDRCNLDVEQRADFIAAATELACEVHAVALALAARVCAERAAGRTGHEGGVGGPGARAIVFRMAAQAARAPLPAPAEGLASVLVCRNDKEAACALKAWAAYGQPGNDPAALFQAARPSRPLDRFLRMPANPADVPRPGTPAAAPQEPPSLSAPSNAATAAASQHSLGRPARLLQELATAPVAGAASPSGRAAPCEGNAEDSPSCYEPPAKRRPAGTQVWTAADSAEPPGGADSEGQEPMAGAPVARVSEQQSPAGPQKSKPDAFARMLQAARGKKTAQPAKLGGQGPKPSRHAHRTFPAWGNALQRVALDPDRHGAEVLGLRVMECCVLFEDKWPKARAHALVLPRDAALPGPADLAPAHLPLLDAMQALAEQWMQDRHQRDPALVFRLGFHAVPSMAHLHLHVVSQDFVSECLKTKKHWNSFNTPFFIALKDARKDLEEVGSVRLPQSSQAEAWLGAELRCNRCKQVMANMPALTRHLRACTTPLKATVTASPLQSQ